MRVLISGLLGVVAMVPTGPQQGGGPQRVILNAPVTTQLQPLRPGDPCPAINVMVNGKGPFKFLVETGYDGIDLSQSLIDSLHLSRNGGSDSVLSYHLDRIAIGDARFEEMSVSVAPPVVREDGVLGLPFFARLLLTIDYPAGQLRLERDTLPTPDGQEVLALHRAAFWEFSISLAGHDTLAVLDTQNSGSIGMPPEVAERLPFDSGLVVVGRARGAFGEIEVRGGRLSGPIRIGRYTFPQPFLRIISLPPDYPRLVNVGSGLLRNFVVSLDQQHGRLRLSHQGDPTIPLPEPARRPPPSGPGS